MIELIDASRPVSLYVHVPFCVKKCGYCAFYSLPESALKCEEKEKYFSVLMAELEELVSEYTKPFNTIFIGGGNPATLGWERLEKLLALAERNGKSREVTVEINPEFINAGISKILPLVTRISIGVQSFDSGKLKTLSRNTTRDVNLKALEMLSELRGKYGFDYNADLICCVPGESEEILDSDLETIISYSPDHISLYALSFEEGTPLTSKYVPLDDDLQNRMLLSSWKRLSEAGYRHYEISNFAKEGKECLHNLVYWNLGQYIGLGPSAESSLGYENIVSLREKDTLDEYLNHHDFDASRLTVTEAEEEYLLVALRKASGIEKKIMKNASILPLTKGTPKRWPI
jgi:putative oxygen-independent coproporphyrinogen III oxidase